jgi:hypothetical protein
VQHKKTGEFMSSDSEEIGTDSDEPKEGGEDHLRAILEDNGIPSDMVKGIGTTFDFSGERYNC